jgi:hypothetical protein
MLTCEQAVAMATDRAEGDLGRPERERLDRHLAGCDGCRAYARQLELTTQTLRRLPDPGIPPALDEALMAQFDRWAGAIPARPEAPPPAARVWVRTGAWPAIGTVATLGLLLAFAHERSQAPGDWATAALLALAALGVAAMAGRLAVGVVGAAVAASVAAALFTGRAGPLAADHGVFCLGTELVAAAAVGGVAWLGSRGGPREAARRSLAAGAVAGALAADAALQVMCGATDSAPHLLAFHVGGVILAAAAAAALLRRRPERARA